jgi:hypothetical protein
MALGPGERERLVQQYADGPTRLRAAFAKVPAEARQWRPGPGEWSAHEVVVHCADSETNGAMRIRYLMAEKDPVLVAYDHELWARHYDYHAHPLEPALAAVEAVRANTVALLRRLPEAAWMRVGRHTESGRYTGEDWLRIYAEHLEIHGRQIETNVETWAVRGSPR